MSLVGSANVASLTVGLTGRLLIHDIGLIVLVRSNLRGRNVSAGLLVLLLGTSEGLTLRLIVLAEDHTAANEATHNAKDDSNDGPDGHLSKLTLETVLLLVGLDGSLFVNISA